MVSIRISALGGIFVDFLAIMCLACIPSSRGGSANADAGAGKGFAVVELFTSEGCSSCPPADALLAELEQQYEKSGQQVFFVAFHVDYWDHLGWKDPFGDSSFSKRQQAYARVLKGDGVYTPQMIVNGTDAFVGSDRKKAAAAIQNGLRNASANELTIRLSAPSEDRMTAEFKVRSSARDAVVNIALVQRDSSSKVARGENRGRSLKHRNVVLQFESVHQSENGSGNVELKLPPAVDRKNLGVIAFVQRPEIGEILAATESAIPVDAGKK